MKALLELVDTEGDLARVRAICAKHKVRILHRKHGVELTDTVASKGITTNYGGYGSRSGVNLGVTFGEHWRVEPDDPRGRPFALLTIHLADPTFDRPREEIVKAIEVRGGQITDSPELADIVVYGGADANARFGKNANRDARLVIAMSTFERALPRPKAPLPAGVVARKVTGDLTKVWTLLSSRDAESIVHGLQILASLDDSDAFDTLLSETDVNEGGQLVRGGRFKGTRATQQYLDVALLGVLSAAPPGSRGASLRASIRSLDATISFPPNLQGFDRLEALDLRLAVRFDADGLVGFGPLPALRSLSLGIAKGNDGEVSLRSLDGLDAPRLERVEARKIGLRQIDSLRHSSGLTSVDLAGNGEITCIGALVASRSTLRYLNLQAAKSLASIEALGECNSLEWVTLEGCASVRSLEALKGRQFSQPEGRRETAFSLDGMTSLTDLFGLPTLPAEVTRLSAFGVPLVDISGIASNSHLEHINLSGARHLCLSPICGMRSLKTINLREAGVSDVSVLGTLASLESVDISHCSQIVGLPMRWSGDGLRSIRLSYCTNLATLGGLRGSFTSLSLVGCTSLSSLEGLEAPAVERIEIEPSVHDLGPLKSKQGLSVELRAGTDEELSPACLAALGAIDELVLKTGFSFDSRCELKKLSALANLRSLDLEYANMLEDISFLCAMPKLESLRLSSRSPASGLAGGSSFDGVASLNRLRRALAAHYGLNLEKESPYVTAPEPIPLTSADEKLLKTIRAKLVSEDPAVAADGLDAVVRAGRPGLFDALIDGIDATVFFTSKSKPIHSGRALKVTKVSAMPRMRWLFSNILAAASPEAHRAVALRRSLVALDLECLSTELDAGIPMPDLSDFSSLERLSLVHGDGKRSEEGQLKGRTAISSLGFAGNPPALFSLRVEGWPDLASLAGVERCPLAEIEIVGCHALVDLSASWWKRIRSPERWRPEPNRIDLSGAGEIMDLGFLKGLPTKQLIIRVAPEADLSPLATMPSLTELHVVVHRGMLRLPELRSVERLELDAGEFRRIPGKTVHRGESSLVSVAFDRLSRLRRLAVDGFALDFERLEGTGVEEVVMRNVAMRDFRGLGKVPKIEIDGWRPVRIQSCEGLEGSPATKLGLEFVDGLSDARALADMPALRTLTIATRHATVIPPLPRLKELVCKQFEGSLEFLEGWTGLEILDLRGSGSLTHVETLVALPALKTVLLRTAKKKRDSWPSELQGKLDYIH